MCDGLWMKDNLKTCLYSWHRHDHLVASLAEIQPWWRWERRVWRDRKMDLEEIWLEKRRCRYERRFLHILRSSCSKSRNLQRSDKMLKHAHLGYAASPHNVHQELSQDCWLEGLWGVFDMHNLFVNLKITLNLGTPESLGPKGDVCWGSRGFRKV